MGVAEGYEVRVEAALFPIEFADLQIGAGEPRVQRLAQEPPEAVVIGVVADIAGEAGEMKDSCCLPSIHSTVLFDQHLELDAKIHRFSSDKTGCECS